MIHLRNFEDYIREGIVTKQRSDTSRAASLREEAVQRKAFVKEMQKKIGVRNEYANYFVENAYDILMELIRAKLFIDGFKAAGSYAHEAEVSYLRKLGFREPDVRFINELRYFRNGIVYYGKKIDADYATTILKFLDEIFPKLEKLLGMN